uniref:Uncharacterized protein n=1 Tax=Zooxanthella nutricula TaxID=1333877 RepID=A0A7S2VM64_9DINO
MDWGPIPDKPPGAGRLLQAQVFVRHGARAQIHDASCWPGGDEGAFTCDLWSLSTIVNSSDAPLAPFFRAVHLHGRDGLPGNCAPGQLVESGYEMGRRNGRRLRDAYIAREDLLTGALRDLPADALRVRSTDFSRTKQSAMALISGMYNESQARGAPGIAMRIVDQAVETMIVNPNVCPAAAGWQNAFFQSLPNAQAAELQAVCARLDITGSTNEECMNALGHSIDCLMSRLCPTVPFSPHNRTVPQEFLNDDASLLRRLWKVRDEVYWAYFKSAVDAGAFGALAGEVLALAEGAVSRDAEAPKLAVWSGHDTGPMEPLYAAFDLRPEPPFWPAFGSMLILEVWESTNGSLARWISDGAVVQGPMPFSEFQLQARALVRTADLCHDEPARPDHAKAEGYSFAEGLVKATDSRHWGRTQAALARTALVCCAIGALVLARWFGVVKAGSAPSFVDPHARFLRFGL